MVCDTTYDVGCHGIRDGAIYSEYYCNTHWRQRMSNDPQPKPKGLEADIVSKGFHVSKKNNGLQWIISRGKIVVDYWPSKQKIYVRHTKQKLQGESNLISTIESIK